MKRSTTASPRCVQITPPCAPFTHHWTRTRTHGVSLCLFCGAHACCPRCRREQLSLLSIGTWIIICASCAHIQQEQQLTKALEEVFV